MIQTFFRSTRLLLPAFLLLGHSLVLHAEETAATTVDPSDKYGDWVRMCETIKESETIVCGLVQNVLLKESGQSVLKIIIRNDLSGSTILLSLPLGFAIPPGVAVNVDKSETIQKQVQTCTQSGCLAGWQLDEEFINIMKRGVKMYVTIMDLQGKPFQIPVSLSGFTKGFDSLSKE